MIGQQESELPADPTGYIAESLQDLSFWVYEWRQKFDQSYGISDLYQSAIKTPNFWHVKELYWNARNYRCWAAANDKSRQVVIYDQTMTDFSEYKARNWRLPQQPDQISLQFSKGFKDLELIELEWRRDRQVSMVKETALLDNDWVVGLDLTLVANTLLQDVPNPNSSPLFLDEFLSMSYDYSTAGKVAYWGATLGYDQASPKDSPGQIQLPKLIFKNGQLANPITSRNLLLDALKVPDESRKTIKVPTYLNPIALIQSFGRQHSRSGPLL